jgi:hypothetical protein
VGRQDELDRAWREGTSGDDHRQESEQFPIVGESERVQVDPSPLIVVAVCFDSIGVVACVLRARRTTMVDPVAALRKA